MKVSIAWVFDHIGANYRSLDIPSIVAKINQTTAEIERSYPITSDLTALSLVKIQEVASTVTAHSAEWVASMTLPKRDGVKKDQIYLIAKEGARYRWATSLDFGGHKEMLLPAIYVQNKELKGAWKKSIELHDYIFEVDNKSINHRPDLWGHRGFAREIAAILDLPLLPIKKFCTAIPVLDASLRQAQGERRKRSSWHLSITPHEGCNRFAGLAVPSIEPAGSLLWMVGRLSRVDSKAINALVDCTNYVMLDISQPMHAFDAHKLGQQSLTARRAFNKETLVLLDDQKIELTSQDIIVADGDQPVALAGIMGGKESAVSDKTTALFLESAHFDAATIRRSSQRHKLRTESSARFEKTLDPNQNILAIQRYVKLLQDNNIGYGEFGQIVSVGESFKDPVIVVRHSFIEERIGTSIAVSFVKSTLKKLEFQVVQKKDGRDTVYHVTVPSFRATKDVTIPEDIVEEIARFFGYGNIPQVLPRAVTKASAHDDLLTQYQIKQQLAFGSSMRELSTYAFFDEAFLQSIKWQPAATANVKDPVSQNWYRLATTLIPAMFKAVAENHVSHDELRFFEWGRTWHQAQDVTEKKVVTGIFYKKEGLTFYDIKAELLKLFNQLSMPVFWSSLPETGYPWFDFHQTAMITHEGKSIGIMGMVDHGFMGHIAPGVAYLFELDAQALLDYKKPLKRFEPLPKYPSISRDISVMASLSLTVDEITALILAVDSHIKAVTLVDMFQKKEWKDVRALTFSFLMRDAEGTMVKQQADSINEKVIAAVTAVGAVIR